MVHKSGLKSIKILMLLGDFSLEILAKWLKTFISITGIELKH